MATPSTPSRGMGFHPYYYSKYGKSKFVRDVLRGQTLRYPDRVPATGKWVHNPAHVAVRAITGAGLAGAIAAGNLMTRGYRQKPLVGLTKAEHKRKEVRTVDIPTVTQRRVKSYKNKILSKSKAMPYRRKRYSRKKRSIKKRFRKKPRIPLGIPQSKVVRFRLVHSLGGLGSASGALSQWALKANSLNDPTGAIAAGLPLYLDQWSGMYTKYIVLGSKLVYKPQRVSSTGPIVCGVHLADNSTSLADHDYYKEAKLTKSTVLTDQRPSGTIVMKYSGKRFWKVRNIKDDSEQEATFSTTPGDPTDVAYYHIYHQDLAKTDAITVEASIIMEFIVLLTNPVIPTRSSL